VTTPEATASGALPADAAIVARLRAGDESMFAALIEAWSSGMLRAARAFVADEHAAQDVVQEAWLGVVRGIGARDSHPAAVTGTAPVAIPALRRFR
jgi:RNA polymerase sigma-70 factor (ECF subfamily)